MTDPIKHITLPESLSKILSTIVTEKKQLAEKFKQLETKYNDLLTGVLLSNDIVLTDRIEIDENQKDIRVYSAENTEVEKPKTAIKAEITNDKKKGTKSS